MQAGGHAPLPGAAPLWGSPRRCRWSGRTAGARPVSVGNNNAMYLSVIPNALHLGNNRRRRRHPPFSICRAGSHPGSPQRSAPRCARQRLQAGCLPRLQEVPARRTGRPAGGPPRRLLHTHQQSVSAHEERCQQSKAGGWLLQQPCRGTRTRVVGAQRVELCLHAFGNKHPHLGAQQLGHRLTYVAQPGQQRVVAVVSCLTRGLISHGRGHTYLRHTHACKKLPSSSTCDVRVRGRVTGRVGGGREATPRFGRALYGSRN